ncbi:MAG: DUF378 domain-containing protein [Holosporales bacterium]
MKVLDTVKFLALILVIVGAVNWGLVGLLHLDLVKVLFGETVLTKLVYILVGVSGVLLLPLLKDIKK